MRQKVKAPGALKGEVHLPGDKSISHRAAILNGIAQGNGSVSNFAQSDDCLATVSCLRSLGVKIDFRENDVAAICGVGEEGLTEAGDVLNAGNSATAMRLLTGLLAAQPFMSIITGDESLRSRPMDRIIRPLRLMGAQIWGRNGDCRAPLAVRGGDLQGIQYDLPIPSAQLKSALLLAGLFARGDTVLVEPMPSRDHTERLLRYMGARIDVSGNTITLSTGQLRAVDIVVPGDISSAAFWLVAGAIHPEARIRIPDTGVNPTRSGIIDVLRAMGASIKLDNERDVNGEPVADLEVKSSSLNGIEIGGELIPRVIDEIPLIALAASFARGRTVIKDARELRVKETDRISTTAGELSKLNAAVEELPDGMVISGGRKLRGADCDSHSDHRLAMMLGIAGLIAEGETTIDNAEAADVSYCGFWRDLERLSVD